ncbi:MAG: signal peptidase II [Lachnospiraceae bacterium]
MLGCLAALLILVIIDQWSKELAVHGLKDRDTIVLIPGVFELFYLENRGAAFGIFENMRWMFLLGTGLILVLAVFLFRRFPKNGNIFLFYFAYHDRCRGNWKSHRPPASGLCH